MTAPIVPITPLPPGILRLCRGLSVVCLALIVTLPLAVAGLWWQGDAAALATYAHLHPDAPHGPLAVWQRLAGALLAEGSLSLLLAALWHAHRGFILFLDGRHFSAEAVLRLKRFAGWMLAAVSVNLIVRSAMSVLLTINNMPGTRQLAIGIGVDQIIPLFFAGMVWVMAAIIGQGRTIAEENAAYV